MKNADIHFSAREMKHVIFRLKLFFIYISYNLKVQKKFAFLTSSRDVIYLWSRCIMCLSPNTYGGQTDLFRKVKQIWYQNVSDGFIKKMNNYT